MTNDRLIKTCRVSLSFYLMTEHNLDVAQGQLKPEKQQLVLANREEVDTAAEAGAPVFAPRELAKMAKSKESRMLFAARHARNTDAMMRRRFRKFLIEEAKPRKWHVDGPAKTFVDQFVKTSNTVALQTLQQSESEDTSY